MVPEFSFAIDDEIVSEFDFAGALQREDGHFVLPSQIIILDQEYKKALENHLTRKRAFARLGEIGISGVFGTLPNLLADLGDLEALGSPGQQDSFQSVLKSSLHPSFVAADRERCLAGQTLILNQQPCAPYAKLWDYQAYAVAWILDRFSQGLGACLADEMGLGKTLMTIATIKNLKSRFSLPAIVLCPKSLVINWQKEVQKFAPDLKVTEFAALIGTGFSAENKE